MTRSLLHAKFAHHAEILTVSGAQASIIQPPSHSRGARLMAQAIVNPEELRSFAQKLKQFNTMLSDQAGMLANQVDTLSTTWRDQENKKFSEEFREHLRLLAQFVEANNQHIPYLLRKAERIDEYLQQR